MNRDHPSGNGDYELLAEFAVLPCNNPSAIECRVRGSHIDYALSGQVVVSNTKQGCFCVNEDQEGGAQCNDYEIRIMCPCNH